MWWSKRVTIKGEEADKTLNTKKNIKVKIVYKKYKVQLIKIAYKV